MSDVVITPSVELAGRPPRVKLDVVDSNLPAYTEVTVVRLGPDGRSSPVRTPDGGPLTLATSGATRIGTVYDYEAPYGQPVTYSTIEVPTSVSAQVTVDEARVWLIHPGVPELSMPIDLRADSFDEESWATEQGVFWPMGREFPVVHTDGVRKAPAGSVIVRTRTLGDLQILKALLRDTSVLLLNVPPALGLGVDTCYIAVGGVRNRRVVNIGSDPNRAIELPYQVVDRPAGGTQAERQYSDLLVYASYADLMAAYGSYQDLLSGP